MVHLGCWWKRHVNLSTVCFRLKIFAGRATSSYFAICQYSKMKTMKGSVQTRMLHCSSRGSCYCKKCTGKEQRTGELNTLGLSNCDYFWARRADYLWNTAVRSRYSGFCVCLWLADLKTWWTGRARHPKSSQSTQVMTWLWTCSTVRYWKSLDTCTRVTYATLYWSCANKNRSMIQIEGDSVHHHVTYGVK